MRFLKVCVFALFFAGSLISVGQSGDSKSTKDIQAYYTAYDHALASKNVDGIVRLLDPSYVLVKDDQQQETFYETKPTFEFLFKTYQDLKSETHVKRIVVQGDEAFVWSEKVYTAKAIDKEAKKSFPIRHTMRVADTLKKTREGWKLTYSQWLPAGEPWDFGK